MRELSTPRATPAGARKELSEAEGCRGLNCSVGRTTMLPWLQRETLKLGKCVFLEGSMYTDPILRRAPPAQPPRRHPGPHCSPATRGVHRVPGITDRGQEPDLAEGGAVLGRVSPRFANALCLPMETDVRASAQARPRQLEGGAGSTCPAYKRSVWAAETSDTCLHPPPAPRGRAGPGGAGKSRSRPRDSACCAPGAHEALRSRRLCLTPRHKGLLCGTDCREGGSVRVWGKLTGGVFSFKKRVPSGISL